MKLQIEELLTAAKKQAAAHQQKLVLLETMVDNLNMENRETRQPIATTKKAGERSAAKCSTSPFKCMSSRLTQQRNFEMDEELQLDRRRIDELEDLAASRQKEIFRLNKRLAEAETVTYDVIRDLLRVKSDITTHTSSLDHKELQKMLQVALHHTKAALQKEKELQALQDRHNEERASWLEDTGRRHAEVVAAQVAVEKLRQKDFILKAENKRLKADLSRQKKRLVQLQDKMRASLEQGNHDH